MVLCYYRTTSVQLTSRIISARREGGILIEGELYDQKDHGKGGNNKLERVEDGVGSAVFKTTSTPSAQRCGPCGVPGCSTSFALRVSQWGTCSGSRDENGMDGRGEQWYSPSMVDFTRFELDFEDLPSLRRTHVQEAPSYEDINTTHSVVDVGTDDKAFLPAVRAVVHGDNITRLPKRTL